MPNTYWKDITGPLISDEITPYSQHPKDFCHRPESPDKIIQEESIAAEVGPSHQAADEELEVPVPVDTPSLVASVRVVSSPPLLHKC